MPAQKLTDRAVRSARQSATSAGKVRRFADGDGLALETRPTGECYWRYRFRLAGIANMATLGRYPDVPLAEARERLKAARALVERGINPNVHAVVQRERTLQEQAATFGTVAEEWLRIGRTTGFRKARGRGGRPWSEKYAAQVKRILEVYALPALGRIPVRDVTGRSLKRIRNQVAEGNHPAQQDNGKPHQPAPVVAHLLMQCCSAIMDLAVEEEHIASNPLVGLSRRIARPEPKEKRPLSAAEIAALLAKIAESGMNRTTAIYLELLMMFWCRPGELRQAEWSEFDLDAGLWQVPAAKMKMRLPHTVPLATPALKLLRELRTIAGSSRWLFPNVRRPHDCMTGTTANRALERLGYKGQFSAHGFRTTATTALREAGIPNDWIELQLAHRTRYDVRGRYDKAEHLPGRQRMMAAWADWIEALRHDATADLGVMLDSPDQQAVVGIGRAIRIAREVER